MRKLFASTCADSSTPVLRSTVDAVTSMRPRDKLTHVRGDTLCSGQGYNLFRIIAQNNSIQHSTIRSNLERFVPSCPVIGFGPPYLVVAVHGAIVESGCVLDVDGGGSCRSQGYVFGSFCRQRYVLTHHFCGCIRIVTEFVKNETNTLQPDSLGW